MDYQHVVRDFAERTRQNLEYIENAVIEGESVYEITQLVNSLLGLLVFPQQHYFDRIPTTPLHKLLEDGWPEIKVVGDFENPKNLKKLMRYLRNAVSHFNIRFITDDYYQLHGVRVWNNDTSKPTRPKTWEAEISFEDLRIIVNKFTNLIME